MDAKALAKSKRAHSQHHSKRPHSNQTSKAPSAGNAGAGNKQLGKQPKEKPHQSTGVPRLPSNWDRYEEEFDSGSEDPSSTNPANDVIMAKSKGADYGELLSEAKSQSQSNTYLDTFASLDDVVSDLNQGVSLLAVRGQGILSWIGDNNFIEEDRATKSHETPFLSLNLRSLAEKLTKVDLSHRLFIEEDLLSPEQMSVFCEGEKERRDEGDNQMGSASKSKSSSISSISSISRGAKMMVDDSAIHGLFFPEKDKVVDKDSSDATPSDDASPNQSASSSKQFGRTAETGNPEVAKAAVTIGRKQPVFAAAAAEAELDMLLDSFSETNNFDSLSLNQKSNDSFPVFQPKSSPGEAVTADLDDLLRGSGTNSPVICVAMTVSKPPNNLPPMKTAGNCRVAPAGASICSWSTRTNSSSWFTSQTVGLTPRPRRRRLTTWVMQQPSLPNTMTALSETKPAILVVAGRSNWLRSGDGGSLILGSLGAGNHVL